MLVSIPQPFKTIGFNIGGSLHAITVEPTAVILPASTDENPDDVLRRIVMRSFGLPADQSNEDQLTEVSPR
jgi:hypothetical protein